MDKRWKTTETKEPPSEESDLEIDSEGIIEANTSASQERRDKKWRSNLGETEQANERVTTEALNDGSCRKPLSCS